MDPTEKVKINWDEFEDCLSHEELAAFRSLSHIVYYLPSEPFYELSRGYAWDIEGKKVETEADLLEYSSYVASSIGILCTFVMCYKTGKFPNGITEKHFAVIERAKEMGQVRFKAGQYCTIKTTKKHKESQILKLMRSFTAND